MNNLLTQLLPIVSAVIGSGAFLAVFTDRRKRSAEAAKTTMEGGKASAEGQVALSGQTLEWSRIFSVETEKARERAERAEEQARKLREDVVECERRLNNMQEDLNQLRVSIATCAGGPTCPIRPLRMTSPPTVPPPSD